MGPIKWLAGDNDDCDKRGKSGVKNRRLCCWASHMPSDPAITLAPPWPRKHTILHITHCQWMSESNSFSIYFWQEWTDSRAISQKKTHLIGIAMNAFYFLFGAGVNLSPVLRLLVSFVCPGPGLNLPLKLNVSLLLSSLSEHSWLKDNIYCPEGRGGDPFPSPPPNLSFVISITVLHNAPLLLNYLHPPYILLNNAGPTSSYAFSQIITLSIFNTRSLGLLAKGSLGLLTLWLTRPSGTQAEKTK